MKSKHLGKLILVGVTAICPAMMAETAGAQVGISVGFALPPPIVFAAPPELVVLPGSYVYVAPEIADDMYFVDGWWWRPWQGHWYRSHSYNTGWGYYGNEPSFYGNVNHGWRNNYRDRQWEGQSWNYERMPEQRVATNWSSWKSNNYWSSQQNWGVPGMKQQPRNLGQTHDAQRSDSRSVPQGQNSQYRGGQAATQATERRATQPHAATMTHRASQSQHRSAPPQAHQAQKIEHRGGQPQPHAQSQHTQQPASNKSGQSQGHGGKAKNQGHGSSGSGHGNGKQ